MNLKSKMKCIKCGYDSENNKSKFGLILCTVCCTFAPNNPEELDKYVGEKISSDVLDSFRKHASFRGDTQKLGMIKKASKGKHVSRVPFGYKRDDEGLLVPAQNSHEIEEIFEEFLLPESNLRKLSARHHLSVNGLKKILRNFVYIGKIKFDGQIHPATHQPIISTTLFNHVQDKLDEIKKKK